MTSRAGFYNPDGTYLTEMKGTFNRSWILPTRGIGTLDFSLPLNSDKAKLDYLEFGKLVYIEHDKLPAWGGVIDPTENWGSYTVSPTAYTAEHMLIDGWRIGDGRLMTGPSGELFKQIVNLANSEEDLLIRVGNVEIFDDTRQEVLNWQGLYDEINRIAKRSLAEWDMQAGIDGNGRLYFTTNWRQRIGNVRDYTLKEGYNVRMNDTPMTRQGNPVLVNRLIGFGTSATAATRPAFTFTDEASRSRYRLRISTQQFEGNTTLGTLTTNVMNSVALTSAPRRTFSLTVLDKDDAFYNVRLGDTLKLLMSSLGYIGIDTLIRIIGMAYREKENELDITGDEVTN
ncbi:MAG: hypothetical protein P4L50_03240 [Anaerolineaceae bacterium]|nr:hypothetical protein [Anaerolineaceae bacterium]